MLILLCLGNRHEESALPMLLFPPLDSVNSAPEGGQSPQVWSSSKRWMAEGEQVKEPHCQQFKPLTLLSHPQGTGFDRLRRTGCTVYCNTAAGKPNQTFIYTHIHTFRHTHMERLQSAYNLLIIVIATIKPRLHKAEPKK